MKRLLPQIAPMLSPRRGTLWTILGLVGLFQLSGCSDKLAGGGGLETGNPAISGMVQDSSGKPVEGAEVYLLPVNHNPSNLLHKNSDVNIPTVTSNKGGHFSFEKVKPGFYNIQSTNPVDSTVFLLQNIEVADQMSVSNLKGKLQIPGKIKIHLTELDFSEGGTLFVPGTKVFSSIAGEDLRTGLLTLLHVPPANYWQIKYSAPGASEGDTGNPISLKDSVKVLSGQTSPVSPYQKWEFSYRIDINTTEAGLSEDLEKYPLLIRLDENNPMEASIFQNSQVKGEDVRFTSSKGTPLPFEIERWDFVSGLAAIWVLVDSIKANSDEQYILIHTGNSELGEDPPLNVNNGSNVFDTAQGYLSVWHLGEVGNTLGQGYMDATYNEIHGAGSSMDSNSQVSGTIGYGQWFDGIEDFISAPTNSLYRLENDDYSLSAFARADSLIRKDQIFSIKGNEQPFELEIEDGKIAVYGGFETDSLAMLGTDTILPGNWFYATVVRSSGTCNLYLNGVPDGEYPCPGLVNPNSDIFIGRDAVNDIDRFFAGAIDEIRVSKIARSESWIKMNYESQKQDSDLISISNVD